MNNTQITAGSSTDGEKQNVVKFSGMKIPELTEVKSYNSEYYTAGIGNEWYIELLYMYNNSSIHASILNNLHLKITKDNLDQTYYKIVMDWVLYGGYALEILWNINHTAILKINHIDFSKIRAGMVDENTGKVEKYFFSNNWTAYNNRKTVKLQNFDTNPQTDDHQIFYYVRYSPQMSIYPRPYYNSGLRYIYTQIQLSIYYSNLVKNNFVGNTLLSIHSAMSLDQQEDFEKSIKKQFTGPEAAGSIVVLYGESKENAPEIVKFNSEEDDLKYRFLSDFTTEQISVAHSLPVSLLGVLVPGKLGSASEIEPFNIIYNETIVTPMKNTIDMGYNFVNSYLVKPQENNINQ